MQRFFDWKHSGSLLLLGNHQPMDRNNLIFIFCLFSLSALIGSISSVFLSCTFIWSIICLLQKKFILTTEKTISIVALIFALYPASELLSIIINQRGVSGFSAAAGSVLFLTILPMSSRLALSSTKDVVATSGTGAAMSAILCFMLSLVDVYFLNIDRAEAGLGNPSVLAVFALTLCCFCISFYPVIHERWRNLMMAGFLCGLGAIILAGTRAVWLVTPFVIILAAWPFTKFRQPIKLVPVHVVTAFFAGLFSVLGFNLVSARIAPTLAAFGQNETFTVDLSTAERLSLWRVGWEQAKSSWMFGYGPDTLPKLMAEGRGDTFPVYSHYHNFMMSGMLRGGIIELFALLAVFAVVLWTVPKKPTDATQLAARSLTLSLVAATALPALVGILFTHDIVNAVFLVSVLIILKLRFPKNDYAAPNI